MNDTVRGADAELPRPGDVVGGKYRIDSVVGSGGMGVVLGATDMSLGRPVAIKFLSPAKAGREGAIQRFEREARAAAAIESEHVVRVYEVSTLPTGAPFIVMEHLRGADLAHVLVSRGPLPIEEAVDYVLQACEALGEAHKRGIVHRDLKPQNLFLTQRADGSPCIKVLDFGISKAQGDSGTPNLTSTDVVMGTPLYMSPEQVRSLKNVDARSDIWALGSILFELLTASPIYQAPSASALCAMIAMDPPIPLRARRPQAPPGLEALILRCLHKDPAGRFQDVAALADALVPFASERGRLSATRISRVVRAGSAGYDNAMPTASAPQWAGPGATTGVDPARASFAPQPVPSVSNFPPVPMIHAPGPVPTTQQTWGSTEAGRPRPNEGRGSSAILVAALGVLTGVLLLAGLFGAGYYVLVVREGAASPPTAAAADAGAPAVAAPTATTASLVATSTAAPTTTATTTSTSTAPPPKPKPTSETKDAGAPKVQKDAGADPDKDEAERLKSQAMFAERNCQDRNREMSPPMATTDDQRKKAAERAKLFTCNKGPNASRCERETCRTACQILNDQGCLFRVNALINNGPPPKF